MLDAAAHDRDVDRLVRNCGSSYREFHGYKVLFEGFGGPKPNYGIIDPVALGDIATSVKQHSILLRPRPI